MGWEPAPTLCSLSPDLYVFAPASKSSRASLILTGVLTEQDRKSSLLFFRLERKFTNALAQIALHMAPIARVEVSCTEYIDVKAKPNPGRYA